MPSKANVIARVIFDKNLNYKKKERGMLLDGMS